jgi:hypothetical protein
MAKKDRTKYHGVLGVSNSISRHLPIVDKSFLNVLFQSGKRVLDSELNSLQDVLHLLRQEIYNVPSGFLLEPHTRNAEEDFSFDAATDPGFTANTFHMRKKRAVVAGLPLTIEFTNTDVVGDNLIQLESPNVFDGVPGDQKRTDFVFLEVWLSQVAPSPKATGTITLSSNPSDGDTVTVDGVALVARAAPALATEFQIQGTAELTAIELATVLTSQVASCEGVAEGSVVRVYAVDGGAAGNTITLVSGAASMVVSGATLSGGQDRPYKPSQTKLYRHGNTQSDSATWLDDVMEDPERRAETTQRVQVQYRIRVTGASEDVQFKVQPDGFSNSVNRINAQGGSGAPNALYPFVPADGATIEINSNADSYQTIDPGLWIAGDGSEIAADDLEALDGYVYAIPLCFVFRRNNASDAAVATKGFDPINNTNGAPMTTHGGYAGVLGAIASGKSDRPDGYFADAIARTDILDLRKHIHTAGTDYKAELSYQIQALLDGQAKTWAIDTADKQKLGNGSGDFSKEFLVCNEIGRSTAKGGTNPASGDTQRGEHIRNFDHAARRFGSQSVSERVVFSFYPGDLESGVAVAPATVNTGKYVEKRSFGTITCASVSDGDTVTIDGVTLTARNTPTLADEFHIAATDNQTALHLKDCIVANILNVVDVVVDTNTVVVLSDVFPLLTLVSSTGIRLAVSGATLTRTSTTEWYEGDELHLNLGSLDASTIGSLFEGAAPASSAGGVATPNFSNFFPSNTVITDVVSVYHDDGNYNSAIDQNVQTSLVTGLGTDYVILKLDANDRLATGGVVAATYKLVGSDYPTPETASTRRIFVEVEVTYPIGQGLTDTPSAELEPDTTVTAWNFGAALETDVTQRPADMEELIAPVYRDGFREVKLEYIASDDGAGTPIGDAVVSRNQTDVVMPRRIYYSPSFVPTLADNPTATGRTLSVANSEFGSSSRLMKSTTNFSGAGQTLVDVTYFAQDPIPNYGSSAGGYQVGVYYRSLAPQTSGTKAGNIIHTVDGTLPHTLNLEPLALAECTYSGQRGVGSNDPAFPYSVPLDQIPVNDGTAVDVLTYIAGNRKEWYFSANSNVSVSDFNASTGMIQLNNFVEMVQPYTYTFGGSGAGEFPVKDAEFRAFYPFVPADSYKPTIFAQSLSQTARHKVFTAFLARVTEESKGANDGLLFRKNEIVMVVLSRIAEVDKENTIRFTTTDNRTCASVFKTKNLLLLAKEE